MRVRSLALGVALLVASPSAHATPFFSGLGFLPAASASQPSAVSADGSTVVGSSQGQAFRWTAATGMVSLGAGTTASDVSADGSVVVGTSAGEAFRWTAADGIVGLGVLPGASGGSQAFGVSADGTIVVGASSSTTPSVTTEPIRWTASDGMVGLGLSHPSNILSRATAVSADGSVIVGASFFLFDDPVRSWRWTPGGGLVDTSFVPGRGTVDARPIGLSSDGTVEVGIWNDQDQDVPHEAYLRSAALGFLPLGDLDWDGDPFFEPDDTDSAANAVSDTGLVVGYGTSSGPGGRQAFVWDAVNGMRPLSGVLEAEYGIDLTGWHLFSAVDITADGRTIVGMGFNPDGALEAWIFTVPEPGTAVLLAIGFAGLAARRRSHPPRR